VLGQFGGFSVFALEAIHNHRFKTFISHDGVFDFAACTALQMKCGLRTGRKAAPYWDKNNAVAQRSFSQSPSNFVDKWDTPIMISSGRQRLSCADRTGQQAFQTAS
jgi:hypothetical protein